MSQIKSKLPGISRRQIVVLMSSALTGCGGGNLSALGPPGTGGTGFAALGSIAGFGSVIINGTHIDDSVASVAIDGVPSQPSDLRLGMVAHVLGERGKDVLSATASRIDVWSIAQGTISHVDGSEITVQGMKIQIDSGTVFDGFGSVAFVTAGLNVRVWGLQSGQGGERWIATRLVVVSDPSAVSTGLCSIKSSQYLLNGMVMKGSIAGTIPAGDIIRVEGVYSSVDNTFAVSTFTSQALGSAVLTLSQIEIEGVVAALLPNKHFMLGTTEVDASGTAYSPTNGTLSVGDRIEIEGSWQGGLLVAKTIELRDEEQRRQVEISGTIERFGGMGDFTVRGQRCDASSVLTIGNGVIADIKYGAKVKVKGTKTSDVLWVTSLDILK